MGETVKIYLKKKTRKNLVKPSELKNFIIMGIRLK
jgi:hypothetical protein